MDIMQLLSILFGRGVGGGMPDFPMGGGGFSRQPPGGFGVPDFGMGRPPQQAGSGHDVSLVTYPGPGIQHNPTSGMVSQQPPGIQYRPPTIQTMPYQPPTIETIGQRQTPTSAGSSTSTQGGSRNTMQSAPAPAASSHYLDFLNKGYQPLGFG